MDALFPNASFLFRRYLTKTNLVSYVWQKFLFFLFFFFKIRDITPHEVLDEQDQTKAKLEYSYQSQIEVAASSFQYLQSLKICQEKLIKRPTCNSRKVTE